MEQYKADFIEFMIGANVLQFGDFTLKSGRKSPFFLNTGAYVTGAQLRMLGNYYAEAIKDAYGLEFDVLFGPSYKGIPLAVITAAALNERFGVTVSYCSNRKEIKDHGDTGILLGHRLKDGDRVVIIEDVTTSGLSVAETMPLLKAQADVDVLGLMVSVDREEKGIDTTLSALRQIRDRYDIDTGSIVSMSDVISYLHGREISGRVLIDDEMKARMDSYYAEYGGE